MGVKLKARWNSYFKYYDAKLIFEHEVGKAVRLLDKVILKYERELG